MVDGAPVTGPEPTIEELLDGLEEADLVELIDQLPPAVVEVILETVARRSAQTKPVPRGPLEQAQEIDPKFVERDHLRYLSERLAKAMADVEAGQNRYLTISMPPRMGKTQLTSIYSPLWVLRKHPDWPIGLISHLPELVTSWGRDVRRLVEEHGHEYGIQLAKDAGAVGQWETTDGGGLVSRSAPGQSVTGLGFRVLFIDDAVKDFAAAHSAIAREALWNWWKANSVTRLEPPYLVVVIGTRWHQDDFIGRLLSPEYEGDPEQWERISFPAIAEHRDVLGRAEGEPLLSPLVAGETKEQALRRWADVRAAVGSYVWSALYQQRPSPTEGAIFSTEWFRFWTTIPGNVTADGKVVLFDPGTEAHGGLWLDSWDMAFKAKNTSDYVVGQRWVKCGPHRYLVWSSRDRRTFTQTLKELRSWHRTAGETPYAEHVHLRLVEDKANGTAVIDTLTEEIEGLIAVNPTTSKEGRAQAVTPECESGHVLLPDPAMPGYEWVSDLLAELRDFPTGAHDDQVDAFSQALSRFRDEIPGSVSVPGTEAAPGQIVRTVTKTALAAGQRGHVRGAPPVARPGGISIPGAVPPSAAPSSGRSGVFVPGS